MANVAGAGRFCWFNLAAADPVAAENFYTRIFGWRVAEKNGVTMWETPAGTVGSLCKQTEAGTPGGWLPYIAVPDIGASVARAQALGASVTLPPTSTGMGGNFAHLEDPQGAAFGLYSPADVPWTEPAIGQFCWVELPSADAAASMAFYFDLAGWKEISSIDMGKMSRYHIFGIGGVMYGGIFNPGPSPMRPQWCSYVRVADIAAVTAAAKAAGAQVVNGPLQVPGGDWIVQFMDPQGVLIAAHARALAVPMAKAKPAAAAKAAPKKPLPAKKKAVAKKKAHAKKKAPPKKKAPARKQAARKKQGPVKKKAPARKKVAPKRKAAVRRHARSSARRKK